MLYSLLVAVIVLAIAVPLTGVYCFIKGYNLKAEKEGDTPIKTPRIVPKKAPKGDERLQTLLFNIDNYDGTAAGQKDI